MPISKRAQVQKLMLKMTPSQRQALMRRVEFKVIPGGKQDPDRITIVSAVLRRAGLILVNRNTKNAD